MDEAELNFFSYCLINWEIENCFFVNPSNDTTFHSPEFILQGIKTVKWRMSLELKNNKSSSDGQVSFYLEKLPISQAKHVFVDWEITLTAGPNVFGPFEKKVDFGEESKHGQIGITTTTEILNSWIPTVPGIPDTILIHFYFISYDKDENFIPKEQEDGLFYLSQDLSRLKDSKFYTDIKIHVNDRYIEAHKPILSLNEVFASYIDKAENDVIEISSFDYETIDAFVTYLYSGNVDHIVMNPTLSIIRCMNRFNCDALRTYYIPEEIPMSTKIKFETHEFRWNVADIFDKDEFRVLSCPFKALSNTWRLILSLTRANNPLRYLSLYAQIVDGEEKPSQFCLEFSLLNASDKELFPRRILRFDGCYNKMGFDDFVTKQSLTEFRSLTISGALCVVFRVKTTNQKQKSSLGCHSISYISPTSENDLYRQFSAKIENLLWKEKKFSDMTLVGLTDPIIKAHKCILAARSPRLRRKIKEDLFPNSSVPAIDTDIGVLNLCISYIYSGIFSDAMKSKMVDLYHESAEDKLDIPSLHKESQKYLKSTGELI